MTNGKLLNRELKMFAQQNVTMKYDFTYTNEFETLYDLILEFIPDGCNSVMKILVIHKTSKERWFEHISVSEARHMTVWSEYITAIANRELTGPLAESMSLNLFLDLGRSFFDYWPKMKWQEKGFIGS